MTETAINKARAAINMAENIGAYEIVDELQPLLEMLYRRKCRENMEANAMTGYCLPGMCPNHKECSVENKFDRHGKTAGMVQRDWFGGTGIQPRRHIIF